MNDNDRLADQLRAAHRLFQEAMRSGALAADEPRLARQE